MYTITTEIDNWLKTSTPKEKALAAVEAIALLKSLQSSGITVITDFQRNVLVKLVGFGTLRQCLQAGQDGEQSGYKAEVDAKLRELLTPDEYSTAREASLNAFHTDSAVARAHWQAVEAIGLKGNLRILLPSAGCGVYVGTMPQIIRENSEIIAIEMDAIAAATCRYLYPDVRVFSRRFEKVALLPDSFDLVIDNVPFGQEKVYSQDEFAGLHLNLHNYFLAKSVSLTRPGGITSIVTSTYTMDAASAQSFREYLGGSWKTEQKKVGRGKDAAKVRFIGAVRLPSNSFAKTANTQVTTDILTFQKLGKDKSDANPKAWTQTIAFKLPDADEPVTINQWFAGELRDVMRSLPRANYALLGKPQVNELYGSGFALAPAERFADLAGAIVQAANYGKIYEARTEAETRLQTPDELQEVPNLSFCEWEGKVYRKSLAGYTLEEVPAKHWQRVRDYLSLRRILKNLLALQTTSLSDAPVNVMRESLNKALDQFCAKWRSPNHRENVSLFDGDPYYVSVQALLDDKGNKAPVLQRRTSSPLRVPTKAKNPKDAFYKSLTFKGQIDLDWMVSLLNNGAATQSTIAQVAQWLHERDGLLFFDHALEQWIAREEYLSGDVRTKLAIATEHAQTINITALKEVLPLPALPPAPASPEVKTRVATDLGIEYEELSSDKRRKLLDNTIATDMGGWIPPSTMQQFLRELLELPKLTVRYIGKPTNQWVVDHPRKVGEDAFYGNIKVRQMYGCKDFDALRLTERGLNSQDVNCYDTFKTISKKGNETERKIINLERTEAARGKLGAINAAFVKWLWSNEQRAYDHAMLYNTTVNCYALRKYDGSHLNFPGANEALLTKKPNRWYQNNGIHRILCERTVLLTHRPGLGKSRQIIMGAMKLRQLGLANKPAIVVPKSTHAQMAADFRELYPGANLLVPNENSFTPANRARFICQIAYGDWDAIVITHEHWNRLTMSKDFTKWWYDQILEAAEENIKQVKATASETVDHRSLIKQIERKKKVITERLDRKLNPTVKKKIYWEGTKEVKDIVLVPKRDNSIGFEFLGIDAVFIDEFHNYLNLSYETNRQSVAGLPNPDSDRAQDTYMKFAWFCQYAKTGRVYTATGTAIKNTMAEMFTQMRYHCPEIIERIGVEHFDKFSSMFVKFETAAEITSTGYRTKERARYFKNYPEMMRIFRLFAEIVPHDEEQRIRAELNLPDVHHLNFSSPMTGQQRSYMQVLIARCEAIYNKEVEPEDDNMLVVTGDGRKAALDTRLLGLPGTETMTKLHQCIWNVWQIWKSTRSLKAAQLIFCDFSTPKTTGFDVYNYIRNSLVALGMPRSAIAFIHEAKTPKQRTQLQADANTGDLAVIIGSSQKLGTGLNLQTRLICNHDLDAPWRPSDIEQRLGRIDRQGNLFPHVYCMRYVTEGEGDAYGFDAYIWQLLEFKAAAFQQALSGDDSIRNVEDVTGSAMTYAEVKAIATANPITLRYHNLKTEWQKLNNLLRAHNQEQTDCAFQKKRNLKMIDDCSGANGRIAKLAKDVAAAAQPFSVIELRNKEYVIGAGKGMNNPAQVLMSTIKKLTSPDGNGKIRQGTFIVGKVAGFVLRLRYVGGTRVYFSLKGQLEYDGEIVAEIPDLALREVTDLLKNIQGQHDRAIEDLARAHKALIDLDEILGVEFPHRDRLDAVAEEIKSIEAELRAQEDARIAAEKEKQAGKKPDVVAAEDGQELGELTDEEMEQGEQDLEILSKPVLNITSDAIPEIIEALKSWVYTPKEVQDVKLVDWLGDMRRMCDRLAHQSDDNVIQFPGGKAMGIEREDKVVKLAIAK